MRLEWLDDRWHLDGRGIHAGDFVEIRWTDGTWEEVRVESGDRGRRLYAHALYHGERIAVEIDDTRHALRWPARATGRRFPEL